MDETLFKLPDPGLFSWARNIKKAETLSRKNIENTSQKRELNFATIRSKANFYQQTELIQKQLTKYNETLRRYQYRVDASIKILGTRPMFEPEPSTIKSSRLAVADTLRKHDINRLRLFQKSLESQMRKEEEEKISPYTILLMVVNTALVAFLAQQQNSQQRNALGEIDHDMSLLTLAERRMKNSSAADKAELEQVINLLKTSVRDKMAKIQATSSALAQLDDETILITGECVHTATNRTGQTWMLNPVPAVPGVRSFCESAGNITIRENVGVGQFNDVFFITTQRDLSEDRSVVMRIVKNPKDNKMELNGYEIVQMVTDFLIEQDPFVANINFPLIFEYGLAKATNENPLAYAVMEFFPEGDLSKYIWSTDKPILSGAQCYSVIINLCQAVQTVHEAGYLHLDVKPQNILARQDVSNIVLTDFGNSCSLYNLPTNVVGTVGYTAPEVYQGNKYSTASDVFSTGITIAFALISVISKKKSPGFPGAVYSEGYINAVKLRNWVITELKKHIDGGDESAKLLFDTVDTMTSIEPSQRMNITNFTEIFDDDIILKFVVNL